MCIRLQIKLISVFAYTSPTIPLQNLLSKESQSTRRRPSMKIAALKFRLPMADSVVKLKNF